MPLADVLALAEQGRIKTTRKETGSVGTTVTQLASGNANRARLVVVNTGSTILHLEDDAELDTSRGFTLNADDSMIFEVEEDGDMLLGDWFIVSESAGGTYYVREAEVDR